MEERIKNNILKKISLPREVVTKEPKIVVVGKEEITIENHKGIEKFDERMIILATNIGKLILEGENFEIVFIEEETIVVKGAFVSLYYGVKNDE